MPDLGKYAVDVLAAYGGGLAALVVLVAASFLRARSVRRMLDAAEDRWKNG